MSKEGIFGEYSLVNNEKSENQRKDTMNIIERWESCESIDEAKKLLDYTVSTPSKDWLLLVSKAERGEVKYSELLVECSDDIYSSIAEAVADSDNLVRYE